jgi:hypothetical protein
MMVGFDLQREFRGWHDAYKVTELLFCRGFWCL